MNSKLRIAMIAVLGFAPVIFTGCQTFQRAKMLYQPPPPPRTLGSINDEVWMTQERNAEAIDFVIYQHEFKINHDRLNTAGMDHVQQIAARLASGQDFPVIVERSFSTVRPSTEFKYPIHPSPELDLRRREVIVHSLVALGIPNADERVVVAPQLRPGMKATEAARAYAIGFQSGGGRGGGGGGFGGGFGRAGTFFGGF